MSIQRHEVGARMSQAVSHNGVVYLAGQVASDPSADVKGQTEQILAAVDKLLAAAGSDKTKLLATTIYLSDMAGYKDMNAAWDAWVSAGNTPARATVEAKLAAPEYKVEIMVTAAV